MLETAAVVLAVVVAFLVGTATTYDLLVRPQRAQTLVETDWYQRLVDQFMLAGEPMSIHYPGDERIFDRYCREMQRNGHRWRGRALSLVRDQHAAINLLDAA